jgi:hypothetical protein
MVMHPTNVIMEKKQESATGSQVQTPVISIRSRIGYADKTQDIFLFLSEIQ